MIIVGVAIVEIVVFQRMIRAARRHRVETVVWLSLAAVQAAVFIRWPSLFGLVIIGISLCLAVASEREQKAHR